MSSIQHGIQPAHCIVEIIAKYSSEQAKSDMTYDWARHHKTMIVLNGGESTQLLNIREFMDSSNNPYPWDFFEEDSSMDSMITCVGIILPERIYTAAALMRDRGSLITTTDNNNYVISNRPPYKNNDVFVGAWGAAPPVFEQKEFQVTSWELELIMGMNRCGLAI
jgi:hypothetical protein